MYEGRLSGEVDMRYNGTEFEFGRGVNHSINELGVTLEVIIQPNIFQKRRISNYIM